MSEDPNAPSGQSAGDVEEYPPKRVTFDRSEPAGSDTHLDRHFSAAHGYAPEHEAPAIADVPNAASEIDARHSTEG